MTNTELILNMLAEASTKDISQSVNPETFEESKKVARQGGNVAKVALKELESKTGKKVVSQLNAKTALGIDQPKKKKGWVKVLTPFLTPSAEVRKRRYLFHLDNHFAFRATGFKISQRFIGLFKREHFVNHRLYDARLDQARNLA